MNADLDVTTELHDCYDTVVLGSGASGLVAALAATAGGGDVLVLEKAQQLGGTTAVGGGVIWAPATQLSRDGGFEDTPEAGAAYLTAATAGAVATEDVEWYVSTAARAVDFLVSRTSVRLTPLARPDYHLEWPGATAGGRSLDNQAVDLSSRPRLASAIRPSSYFPPLTMAERDRLNGRSPDPQLLADRRATGVRTMGGALIGALASSALDAGITLRPATPVTGLERDSEGDWRVQIDGARIRARNVVIASGGFEWNSELQESFLARPVLPIGAPSNEGDGLVLALAVGAAVRDMTALWGVPVIATPGEEYDGRPTGRMANVEMTLPGSITVNAHGRRFVNEALNYHDASRVFASIEPLTGRPANEPAWLVFDHEYFESYPVAGSVPGELGPGVVTAPTAGALARAIGVAEEGLLAQIEEFNTGAANGEDPQFGRGASAQDRFLGDASHTPNPCLRPLTKAPFYAVRIHPGALGTSGGLRTDHHGRVLDHTGEPIVGLYAAGNVSAGAFRNNYPGGGATLGSAVTRAFAAGAHIAAHRAISTTGAPE